jgi:hypothetical protein
MVGGQSYAQDDYVDKALFGGESAQRTTSKWVSHELVLEGDHDLAGRSPLAPSRWMARANSRPRHSHRGGSHPHDVTVPDSL